MTKIFYFNPEVNVTNIQINKTMSIPVDFAGYISNDKKCKGANYVDKYGSYTNVIVQGLIEITISESMVTVDISNNMIHLITGTVCTYSNFECMDDEKAYSFWSVQQLNKIPEYIYQGPAVKLIHNKSNEIETLYTVNTESVAFKFKKKQKVYIADMVLYRTDEPRLFIKEALRLSEDNRYVGRRSDYSQQPHGYNDFDRSNVGSQLSYRYSEPIRNERELRRDNIPIFYNVENENVSMQLPRIDEESAPIPSPRQSISVGTNEDDQNNITKKASTIQEIIERKKLTHSQKVMKIEKLNKKREDNSINNHQSCSSATWQQVTPNEVNNVGHHHMLVTDYDSTSEGDDQGNPPKNIP